LHTDKPRRRSKRWNRKRLNELRGKLTRPLMLERRLELLSFIVPAYYPRSISNHPHASRNDKKHSHLPE